MPIVLRALFLLLKGEKQIKGTNPTIATKVKEKCARQDNAILAKISKKLFDNAAIPNNRIIKLSGLPPPSMRKEIPNRRIKNKALGGDFNFSNAK